MPSANTLWVALRKKEAAEAWQAMHLLAQNPDVALPLLREHLQPASAPEKEIAYLLAQLDDDNFQVRSRAEVQLEKMGEVIEPALQDALAKKPNPEVLNCIKRLLAKIAESALQSGLYPSQLQAFRGVEVLERIGTPAARQVLEELSRLPARYVQAAESTAALQRLAKLPPASMP